MLGTELLETLLASYAECYDIQRDYPIQDAVYPAYAKFNVTSAKYVLMKKAELWRVNCFEHAFFSVVSSLQTEDLQKLRRQITEYMEPQLVRSGAKYPPPNHMYAFLTAIFISEGRVSPEVKKEAQRFRYFKNYLASIRGYSEAVTPTVVFATGISKMLGSIPGLAGTENVAYTLLVLTVSVFCLTSLDTATRLARYMFQEFWLEPGQTYKDAVGYKKVLTNPLVATLITVVLGITLGLTGYANIWPLFGASNQLLAALGLLAVATWLGKAGKNNKMFYIPMIFMLVVTLTSLVFTLQSNILAIAAGGAGLAWCYVRVILAALLIILAIILAVDSIRTMAKQKKLA